MTPIRTDLALEAHQLWQEQGPAGTLPDLETRERTLFGCAVTDVRITGDGAARALGKPRGAYLTLDLSPLSAREDGSFTRCARALAALLAELLPLREGESVLVAGLGNLALSADAVGPLALRSLLVTRHLRAAAPKSFAAFRPVAAIAPGVLAETGVESREIVRSVARAVSPAAVIAVDALASRSLDRVCRTVQLSDAGIVPGSGVGNAREALDRDALGVPVVALGVPTVVDAATLAADLAQRSGFHNIGNDDLRGAGTGMIVTPRDIDSQAAVLARLLGYGIDLALHPGITCDDVTALLS